MKQLSGDNFSPPRSATRKKMTKVQNDKILKYYKEIKIAKIQESNKKRDKGQKYSVENVNIWSFGGGRGIVYLIFLSETLNET